MPERRRLTLLECAIAASAALVPVMGGIVLLVGLVRPADPDGAWLAGRTDRYVSVRLVAALKTFERAVVERADPAPQTTSAEQVLEGIAPCRAEWAANAGLAQHLRAAVFGGSEDPGVADRVAGQLHELDRALGNRVAAPGLRSDHPIGLDTTRWFAAAREALATPIETPDAPGRTFRVRCADLVAALAALRRHDGAMLDALAWRDSESPAALARWRPEQEMQVAARTVMRRNPWSGAAGCIYVGLNDDAGSSGPRYFVAGPRSLQQRLCALPTLSGARPGDSVAPRGLPGEPGRADGPGDLRWAVPPSLHTLLRPLETLRQPTGTLYRAYTEVDEPRADPLRRTATGVDRRNRVVIDGVPLDVGYSVDLTIDPALQALAQKTAACYTGRHDVCASLGMHRREDGDGALGDKLLEGAMVRMAAVAVIDVGSGRIEALAGALSPCTRDAAEGGRRAAGCDHRLPFGARLRPDALLNPAVYHDAMPASTIKPILAATFLGDPATGPSLLTAERAAMAHPGLPARSSLRGQLMRSDSARFLDRLFCSDRAFASCNRPWAAQETALSFGWNAGCAAGSENCGRADLLFGRALEPASRLDGGVAPAATAVAYGRLLSGPMATRPGAAMQLMAPMPLDADIVRRCAAGADGRRASDDDWEKCRGGAVVDVVAEGWGQGHARASALGVAGMMAALAAAATGASAVPNPHLVAAMHGVPGADAAVREDARHWAAAVQPIVPVPRDAAELILSGLSYSHRAGTARSACEQVFDAGRCQAIDWIAGKTGTPSFPGDDLTLDALSRLCRDDAPSVGLQRRGACGSLRPYKWYVATFRADRSSRGPWHKAIAVLTERNWLRASGRVHGAGDLGPNPSAEIAMQIIGRRTGFIEQAAP